MVCSDSYTENRSIRGKFGLEDINGRNGGGPESGLSPDPLNRKEQWQQAERADVISD